MKLYTEEGLEKVLEGITIDIELEKGNKVLKDDHSGTFLVNSNGLCFKSLDCTLEDYEKGKRIKANYLGPPGNIESLPWKTWPLEEV